MKKLFLALLATVLVAPAVSAQVRVRGYTRNDGTYVAPHYRSAPNGTTLDNYSTRGNVNPYTGAVGTRNPYGSTYSQPSSNPYGSSYSNPYSAPRANPYSSPYSNPYSAPRTTTPCYYNCPH